MYNLMALCVGKLVGCKEVYARRLVTDVRLQRAPGPSFRKVARF